MCVVCWCVCGVCVGCVCWCGVWVVWVCVCACMIAMCVPMSLVDKHSFACVVCGAMLLQLRASSALVLTQPDSASVKKILLSRKVSKTTRKKEKKTKRALAALKVSEACMHA